MDEMYLALVEWQWKEKPKYLEKNLSQCHFVHHKSHMDSCGIELSLFGEKTMTNHLLCGTTYMLCVHVHQFMAVFNQHNITNTRT